MARAQLSLQTLEELQTKLQSDVYTAVEAARMAAELEQAQIAGTEIIVTIHDRFYNAAGQAAAYEELHVSFPRNDVGAGKLLLSRNDPLADLVLTCHQATIPVTIEVEHLLWSGRVKIAHDNFGSRTKADYIECELESDYAWLMKIVAWPDFLLPIQVQYPPRGVAIGPAVSVLKYILATQAFRLQSGLWDLVNDIGSLDLDWRAWFATFLVDEPGGGNPVQDLLSMLRTPIYVVPTDPLFDTSELISVNWRMNTIGQIFKQQVEDNGLSVEVKVWRPGDPQPSDDPMLDLFPLRVPTIVVDIKDRLGVVGPTGTFLDGILRVLVDLQASVFGNILQPFLNPQGKYAPDFINIAPILGLDWVESWAVFNADQVDGGVSGRLSHHTPQAYRVIIGGHSPQWMNDLINATMKYILDMILIVVGLTGIPSNLFDGLFNNILLAFQLADNFERRLDAGPYCYPEVFVATTNSPYTLDAIFTLKRQMWKTRGYIAGQIKFRNGSPYEIGRDLFVGGLATIIRNGKLYTDFVEEIVVSDTRAERTQVFVQIGDGKQQASSAVKVQRKVVGYEELFNILLMGQQT